MRIGVISTSYPRFAGDPAGNFVAGHAEAMQALGHDVEVIAAGDTRAADAANAAPRVHRIAGAGLFYRGGAPDALERAPVATALSAVAVAARMTASVVRRARRWDAAFAHWLVPSALAALPTTIPLVAIAHGGDIFTLRRLRLLGPALRLLHRRRARLVFVAEHLRALAIEAAPHLAPWLGRAKHQPMGLPLARFAALTRVAPTGELPTILVVARLVPIKGVDTALAALAHLQARARLVVAGDGPERARLERLAPAATFLGAVDTRARDELLRRAAVVVVPSRALANGRTEGTPTIALEALAANVPVIASAVGGLRDLAPHIALVPPDDPRALAAAIDRVLLAAPGVHAEVHSRAAVDYLDWRTVATELLTLIRE